MNPRSRLLAAGLLILLLGSFALRPKPAHAQVFFPPFITVLQDYELKQQSLLTKIKNQITANFKKVSDIAFKNSLQIFTSRLIREAVTQISTASPGQKPLFLTNPQTFFRNVANSAAGDYIDNFSKALTGQSLGAGTNTQRTRFLITKFLKSELPNPLNSCQEQARADYSVRAEFTPGSTLKLPTPQNDHEQRISDLLDLYNKLTLPAFAKDPNGPMTCQGVNTQVPFFGSVQPWVIVPGYPGTQVIAQISAQDCKNHQEEAINNEKSTAYQETLQQYKACQSGLAGAATNAINSATATDVFTSINNIQPSNVPSSLANALSQDKSDVGQLIGALGGLTAAVQTRVTGEQTNLQPNTLPKTATVSGNVTTPSAATTATLYGIFQVNGSGQFVYTGTGIADILKGVASFINSPIGQLFFQSFKNKCGFNPDACKGPTNPQSTIGQLLFGTGVAAVQQPLSSLGQPELISGNPGQNDIAITDQLTSSGLIDSGFRQAIEEELTVQEALDKKLLDGQKVFGFDRNGVEPRDGYTYRAMQYLRKFRVIPIGWELAAKYKQQFDNRNLTLNSLVKAYNICGQDPQVGTCSGDTSITCTQTSDCGSAGSCTNFKFTSTHEVCTNNPGQSCQQDSDCGTGGTCGASPYCGLVDPNWVLKAPQSYCRRQGAGEEIVSKQFECDTNNVDNITGHPIPAGQTTGDGGDNKPPNCVKGTGNNYPDIGHWVISRNTDTCADVQSCIAENDDGSCIAYGYCVQERQTFKFNGTQCDAQNVSCTTYTNNDGQQQSYLAKTLDFRNCSADNAGCQWYCRKTCSLDSSRSCSVDADCAPSAGSCTGGYDAATNTWTCSDPTQAKPPVTPTVATNPPSNTTIDFNDKVATCDQNSVGCQQYIRTTNGTNLLPNSGFETITNGVQVDSGNDAIYADWIKNGGIRTLPVTPDDNAVTANNSVALNVLGTACDPNNPNATCDNISQTIDTGAHLYEQTFTASIRAKSVTACSPRLIVSTNLASSSPATDQFSLTSDWQTYTTTLVVPPQDQVTGTDDHKVTVKIQMGSCTGFNADNVQLEHDGPSAYKDYGSVNTTYLGAKRQLCTPDDVGCQLYTPKDGSPAIPGQVLNSNKCDASNVGCNLYHLEPITTVPQRPAADVTVVATKGQQCSASDVGCEEYTNLDVPAQSGEAKAYFKAVKQCVKPNAADTNQTTYYTWVGDPQSGFVLRAYDLLKSNIADTNGNFAPCTNMTIGTTTTASVCDDANRPDPTDTICNASTFASNPDCGQYYDSALNVFYRLRQSTVSVTADCHPYKNTIDQTNGQTSNVYYLSPSENVSCSAQAAGCRAYTGNASQTSRQTFSDTFENGTTSNWIGGSISNASIALNGHSMLITGANGAAFMTSPAVSGKLTQGKTYQLSVLAASAGQTQPQLSAYVGQANGNTFNTVTPFQRDSAGNPVSVTPTWNNNITPPGPEWHSYNFGLLTINGNPSALTIGLTTTQDVYVDNITLTEINDSLYLVSSTVPACPASEVGCAAYTNASGQTVDLKSFSRICSQQVLNCEALIDTHNSKSPDGETIKGITTPADNVVDVVNDPANSCQATAKSCQAFGLPVYSSDHLLTGYQTVYLKNDPDSYSSNLCVNNELFCRAYTTSSGTAAFFKDPTNQTCEFRSGSNGSAGQWFIVGTSTPCATVKPPEVGQPVGASCAPVCAGGQRTGRVCTTNSDCPGSTCSGDPSTAGKIKDANGAPVVGQCTDSTNCLGGNTCVYQVGICPDEQNTCTEYRDPSDPLNCRSECPLVQQGGSAVYVDSTCSPTTCQGGAHAGQNCQVNQDCGDGGQCVGASGTPTTGAPGCRAYDYLQSTIEDASTGCNGQINLATGCRPFNNTSNPTLNFRGK